jgi:hypothetical protein
MRVGKIIWKEKTQKNDIEIVFVGDEVYWCIETLVSKYIAQVKQLQNIVDFVRKELSGAITILDYPDSDLTFVHQFDLDYVFKCLADNRYIPNQVQAQIMRFLNDVPTPTAEEQIFDESGPPESIPFSPPPKEKQEEVYSDSDDYDDDDEEEEEEEKPRKRPVEKAVPRKKPRFSFPPPESESSEEEPDLIGTSMMVCKLINTHLKVIDRNDILLNEHEKNQSRLFVTNLLRCLPQEQILKFCVDPQDEEPEDDSPQVSVSSRIIQLGYSLPDNPQLLLIDIGLMASKLYRKMHDGRYPPQIYRTGKDGTRYRTNKWTLNNCINTLDTAIHAFMSK